MPTAARVDSTVNFLSGSLRLERVSPFIILRSALRIQTVEAIFTARLERKKAAKLKVVFWTRLAMPRSFVL
jgi:hypothetical protein